ncbi:hypothetical protein KI387_003400, partial [Taxus chinensis]
MTETSEENNFSPMNPFVSAECVQGFFLHQSTPRQLNSINPFEDFRRNDVPAEEDLQFASHSDNNSDYSFLRPTYSPTTQFKVSHVDGKTRVCEEAFLNCTGYDADQPGFHTVDHHDFGCADPSEFEIERCEDSPISNVLNVKEISKRTEGVKSLSNFWWGGASASCVKMKKGEDKEKAEGAEVLLPNHERGRCTGRWIQMEKIRPKSGQEHSPSQ